MLSLDLPLTALERADLIRVLRDPERAYLFKHNLVQETVHATLLKNDRRLLHRVCAEVLEQTYPELLDENAARLAQHYMEAGDELQTYRYTRRAGDCALRQHAYAEALMHYDTALVLAPRLPLAADEIVKVYQDRGRTAELMGSYADAIATYEALRALGAARGDRKLELGAMLALLTPYTIPSPMQNLELAAERNAKALTLARELGDGQAETRILWNSLLRAYFAGDLQAAHAYGSAALERAEELELTELRAYILNDISRTLISVESARAAMDSLDRARALWREQGNLPMLADNLATSAENAGLAGNWDLADQYIRDGLELVKTIGNTWNLSYLYSSRAILAALRGEIGECFTASERAIEYGNLSGFIGSALIGRMLYAQLLAELGAASRGLELLETLGPQVTAAPEFALTWWLSVKLRAAFLKGDYDAARALLKQVKQIGVSQDLASPGQTFVTLGEADLALYAQEYAAADAVTRQLLSRLVPLGVLMLRPDLLLRRGWAQLGLADYDAAGRALDEAEELARGMRARPALWEILVAQSTLAAKRGDGSGARARREQARAVIQEIFASIPTDPARTLGIDLRAAMTNDPRYRAVLDD